jgi:hypothetical protein
MTIQSAYPFPYKRAESMVQRLDHGLEIADQTYKEPNKVIASLPLFLHLVCKIMDSFAITQRNEPPTPSAIKVTPYYVFKG